MDLNRFCLVEPYGEKEKSERISEGAEREQEISVEAKVVNCSEIHKSVWVEKGDLFVGFLPRAARK